VVGLVALAGFGCSSDGPTLEEYGASVREVCADYQREADALALPTAGPALAASLRASAELSRDEVEALVAVPRPSDRRSEVDAWLDALGRRVTSLEEYAAAVEGVDPGVVPEVPEDLATATQEAAEAAVALGFEGCGAGVETPLSSPTTTGPTAGAPGPAPVSVPGDEPTPTVTNDVGIPPDETTTQDQ
jgi:cell division septation protein DedD